MSEECECVEVKCPEGIPAWVMTFADLMSLLLAFFVLLFSFSEIDKQAYKQMAGSMKDAFGVQREIRAKEPPRGNNIIAREFSPGKTTLTPDNQIRQMTIDDYHKYPVLTDPGEGGQEGKGGKEGEGGTQGMDADESSVMEYSVVDQEMTREMVERLKRVEHDAEMIQEELSDEIKKGLLDLEVKDQKIILRVREKGSFPSGSAVIIKPFEFIAQKIADVFETFEGSIIVAGHTDNIPIHTSRFRSNWELSASRAVSVIQELKKQKKLKNKHFKIEAYADTQPLEDNKTWKGRAKNRRVEIKLSYEDVPIDMSRFIKEKKMMTNAQSTEASNETAESVSAEVATDEAGMVNDKQVKKDGK